MGSASAQGNNVVIFHILNLIANSVLIITYFV